MSAAQLEPGIGPGDLYYDPEIEKTAVSMISYLFYKALTTVLTADKLLADKKKALRKMFWQ